MNTKLWCVHLAPKNSVSQQQIEKDITYLARGPGQTEIEKMFWVAKAMCGVADNRGEKFVTIRQRLAIFTDKLKAMVEAKKHENEHWKASVREVRVIE